MRLLIQRCNGTLPLILATRTLQSRWARVQDGDGQIGVGLDARGAWIPRCCSACLVEWWQSWDHLANGLCTQRHRQRPATEDAAFLVPSESAQSCSVDLLYSRIRIESNESGWQQGNCISLCVLNCTHTKTAGRAAAEHRPFYYWLLPVDDVVMFMRWASAGGGGHESLRHWQQETRVVAVHYQSASKQQHQ